VCSPRRRDEGGSRISPAAADGGLQPKLHGRRFGGTPALGRGSLDAASRRASPGEDGVARQCSVVAAQVSMKLVQIELAMVTVNKTGRERKRGRDSVGTTSKCAREWQNGKETTRRTRWCAHLRSKMNDDNGRARRSWRGVAEVGEDDGGDVGFA
jgi:hypothetical protein